jgi:AcrR family transcriptional regulator
MAGRPLGVRGGLDGVTTRKLAARLGVRSPALYWHLPNKAALITAIADAILAQQFGDLSPPEPDQHWQDWLTDLAERLRRALLAHPDGVRVISASQLSVTMAAISELAMSTLVARGIPAATGPRYRPDHRALHGRPHPRSTGLPPGHGGAERLRHGRAHRAAPDSRGCGRRLFPPRPHRRRPVP